jgi:fatty acyl-CoA reductase
MVSFLGDYRRRLWLWSRLETRLRGSAMHIQDHFLGKRILLTGVTGFLGKTILEKLLWDVPNIEKIYLLVRPADGSAPARLRAQSRVYESLRVSPAFERLRRRHGDITSVLDRKTEVIPCDLMQEDLGITPEDLRRIQGGLDTTCIRHTRSTAGSS